MSIQIFGHYAPDTDSTGSAIIWAWYLNEVLNIDATPLLLGEPNTEASYMLERFGLEKPAILETLAPDSDCIIVDTNNPAELPKNINDANVIAIIDHHKLVGGLETKAPIDITIRALACTATIMHDLMGEHAKAMPDAIKGATLSCILSDTLGFRSPTTTDHDRALAHQLAEALGLDLETFAEALFAAKSDVSSFSDAELLRMDSKAYTVDGTPMRISVLETTTPELVLARKASLMQAMPALAAEDGVEQVLLFVIDIFKQEATLLIPNATVEQIARHSFEVAVDGDTVVLPGILSRKKQIIPSLKL